MSDLGIVVVVVVCVAAGHGMAAAVRWFRRRAPRHMNEEAFSDPGYSVEVDCRGCGQFNRVPSHRLRDHPKCGRCKARLMPKRRIVICRVSTMSGPLRAELDAVWTDEDRLWQSLADHVTLETKARGEAQGSRLRVVN
jgi:hypothetical protein